MNKKKERERKEKTHIPKETVFVPFPFSTSLVTGVLDNATVFDGTVCQNNQVRSLSFSFSLSFFLSFFSPSYKSACEFRFHCRLIPTRKTTTSISRFKLSKQSKVRYYYFFFFIFYLLGHYEMNV
jgi:hypothetical protein